jgi:hypothetical protein
VATTLKMLLDGSCVSLSYIDNRKYMSVDCTMNGQTENVKFFCGGEDRVALGAAAALTLVSQKNASDACVTPLAQEKRLEGTR